MNRWRVPWTAARVRCGCLILAVLGMAGGAGNTSAGEARASEVHAVVLSVGDLDREVSFYTNVLGFSAAEAKPVDRELELSWSRWTGARRGRVRTQLLKLGEERVELSQFVRPKGQPIPADSRSTDHWFQHLALVVRDMDEAYAHLRRWNVAHISTGPQTLPAWNTNAAGIRVFYFKDPEDHVLEVIGYPPGKGDPRWQIAGTNLFLGIDHTAIVVSDTARSLAFYVGALGLRVAGASENWGTEQEHLNQVFGARVRITALRAPKGPGIEFLEYLSPPGGRRRPAEARVQDLLSWRIQWRAEDTDSVESKSGTHGFSIRDPLMADPDGHLLEVVP